MGNNIAVGNGVAVAGHNYTDDEIKAIGDALGEKVIKRSVLLLNTIGSLMVVGSKGALVHPDISERELIQLEKTFGVRFTRASVNQGNPYVSIGVVANKNGVVVGELTRGAELTAIQEGLRVIKGLPGGKNGRKG